ncbi:hypothetical protein SAMN05444363_0288 [Flavobacterium terrae]|uniref:Uncharacterized protein n=1 Tax=Flavobacterium terrae TaxID=415425 RepID=A0A1M6AM53_9FLAO|nr:hypothetical protein SAMN05444363_0288 [Flavobacterium terrae]
MLKLHATKLSLVISKMIPIQNILQFEQNESNLLKV